jgi:hypothetical protein
LLRFALPAGCTLQPLEGEVFRSAAKLVHRADTILTARERRKNKPAPFVFLACFAGEESGAAILQRPQIPISHSARVCLESATYGTSMAPSKT